MNREEARLELDATTLRPQDASPQARGWLQDDPALAAWHERRRSFDEASAEAFAMPVPEDLREALLSTHATSSRRPARWLAPVLVGAAAACLLLGWSLVQPARGSLPEWQRESIVALNKLELGLMKLDDRSSDFEAVKKHLLAAGAPSPESLPGCLCKHSTFGCKRILVSGRPATIICFRIEGGKEAHLIVMEDGSLPQPPPGKQPAIQQSRAWHLASWREGRKTYLLATTAGEAALKRLLEVS